VPAAIGQINLAADSLMIEHFLAGKEQSYNMQHSLHLQYHQKPVLKLALGFYKKVLSEQISANCEFEPTCSSFSWLALDEFGIIKALLLTADRLTRCNGMAQTEASPYLIRNNDAKIVDYPYQYRITR